jgi:chemotaxis protein MotB
MDEAPQPLSAASRGQKTSNKLLWRLLGMLVAALAIAGALGYYAFTLRGEHQETLDELEASRQAAAQVQTLQGETTAALQKAAACETNLKTAQASCEQIKLDATTMQGDLTTTKSELETLRKYREETSKRLAAFKDMTSKFQKLIDNGKVDVITRNGRMLIKLPASVLFSPGSADLSRPGELALMEVAIVLRQFEDRKFMIEGHTDDRLLEDAQNARFRNNWELSAARAVTVTQFLIEARMRPENLVAAGHAAFDPVADNRTTSGRQANRRIEIVLLPNIDELPVLDDSWMGQGANGAAESTGGSVDL